VRPRARRKGGILKEHRVADKEKNRLSNVETQRLWIEVQLLESYLNYPADLAADRAPNITVG
jgi:hypothetical protein